VSEAHPEIIVVGSHAPGLLVSVDILPRPGETILGHSMTSPPDGGKGSNQAIAAAALGANVAFVGRVGDDDLGNAAIALMSARGINVDHLSRSANESTGCGVNIVDKQGIPEMIVIPGANAELSAQHVSSAFETYRQPKVVLTQMEIDPLVALHAARMGKLRGAIAIVNAAPATAWPLPPAERADVVDILVVNETEAALLDTGTAQASAPGAEAALAARLQETLHARTVIITLGERGLVAREADTSWALAAPDVVASDTSGAGDVFCAALAVALTEGLSIREASVWANSVAGLSVTRAGTIPAFPTRAEVDAVIDPRTVPIGAD
jgi:ribokinase